MIDKILEQQETIKGLQNNQDSLIKIMKEYEQLIKKYNLMKKNANQLAKRIDKAIEYIEKKQKDDDNWLDYELCIEPQVLLDIFKGDNK